MHAHVVERLLRTHIGLLRSATHDTKRVVSHLHCCNCSSKHITAARLACTHCSNIAFAFTVKFTINSCSSQK